MTSESRDFVHFRHFWRINYNFVVDFDPQIESLSCWKFCDKMLPFFFSIKLILTSLWRHKVVIFAIFIIVREVTLIEHPIVFMELFVVVEELFVVEEVFF